MRLLFLPYLTLSVVAAAVWSWAGRHPEARTIDASRTMELERSLATCERDRAEVRAPLPPTCDPDAQIARWVVDRAVLTKRLTDPREGVRLGRALLHRGPDGSFDGYRLSALAPDGLASRIGLRNGDVVHAVAGHRLTSIQEAMHAWTEVMEQDTVEVVLSRRGEPRILVLELVDP